MLTFEEALDKFRTDQIRELSLTDDGMKFLKLRSLSRKDHMAHLIEMAGLDFRETNSREWLKNLYEADLSTQVIEDAIQELYEAERAERRATENELISELYKIHSFEWGGLHQNSLEKTIIDNYVKKIKSYTSLTVAIENDLHNSMRAYVLASWYNHWTSILIEDIFKDHNKVIPAVGLIKKIDFFIQNKPFDLKVTYLPEGYIKAQRKGLGLRPELTLMKKVARNLGIGHNSRASDSFLIPDLWRKLDDHPAEDTNQLIAELQHQRESILNDCMQTPSRLVRWLYENQGIRRFDASNRLFLILVDKSNFFESWKLKRAKPLIAMAVNQYLDAVDTNLGFELDFNWENNNYTTESDVIFVLKQ